MAAGWTTGVRDSLATAPSQHLSSREWAARPARAMLAWVRRLVIAAGTLGVHAVLGLLLVALDAPRVDDRPGSPLTIELVEPAQPAPVAASDGSGHAGPDGTGAGGQADRPQARRSAPRHAASARDGLTTTIERGNERDGLTTTLEGVDGPGNGDGAGNGGGFGHGTGRLADLVPPPAPVPPPPPAPGPPPTSKARPARLIYPSRQVQIDDALLFVASLDVDADGFVAGARLIRGFGGPRDDQAAGLVWRFRYAPALDDNGRAIGSRVEQKFNVGR